MLQSWRRVARCFNEKHPKIGLFDMPYFTTNRKVGKYGMYL
nr:MAG TPA: hypothetical protein [Caudoviricetes sp.]